MTDSTTPTNSRITLDDVRTAIAGTDPNTTNASKIRSLLGNRGSFETIQRHLDTLRAELVKPIEGNIEAPKAPVEAIQAVWSAAWQAASLQTSNTLARALQEKEKLLAELTTYKNDALAANAQADLHNMTIESLRQQLETERKASEQSAANIKATQEKMDAELASAKSELEQVKATQKLQNARHEAAIATLRSELDRQINLLADLRANRKL